MATKIIVDDISIGAAAHTIVVYSVASTIARSRTKKLVNLAPATKKVKVSDSSAKGESVAEKKPSHT